MTDDHKKIDDAANALAALGSTQPQEPPPADPFVDLQAAAQQAPVRKLPPVVIKKVGKIKNPEAPKIPKPPRQKKVRAPAPPPPALSAVEKMHRTRQIQWRRTAIPLLISTGLAMLAMACWSAQVLIMGQDIFHPAAAIGVNTKYLAKLALLAWPLAAILLGGAALFMHEVYAWFTLYPPPLKPKPPKPSQPH